MGYYNYKRISRKLKKKVKRICGIHIQKDINSSLWYYLGIINERLRDYLISKTCEKYVSM
jgi:hypothetical protein